MQIIFATMAICQLIIATNRSIFAVNYEFQNRFDKEIIRARAAEVLRRTISKNTVQRKAGERPLPVFAVRLEGEQGDDSQVAQRRHVSGFGLSAAPD
jgi:hypothetical protein